MLSPPPDSSKRCDGSDVPRDRTSKKEGKEKKEKSRSKRAAFGDFGGFDDAGFSSFDDAGFSRAGFTSEFGNSGIGNTGFSDGDFGGGFGDSNWGATADWVTPQAPPLEEKMTELRVEEELAVTENVESPALEEKLTEPKVEEMVVATEEADASSSQEKYAEQKEEEESVLVENVDQQVEVSPAEQTAKLKVAEGELIAATEHLEVEASPLASPVDAPTSLGPPAPAVVEQDARRLDATLPPPLPPPADPAPPVEASQSSQLQVPDGVSPATASSAQQASVATSTDSHNVSTQSATPPLATASGSNDSASSAWVMPPHEVAGYQKMFQGFGATNDEEMKRLLSSSGLPPEDLGHLWKLSGACSSGQPTLSEFLCVMAMVARRRMGAPLPSVVPPPLVQQCQSIADSQSTEPIETRVQSDIVVEGPPISAVSATAPDSSWKLSADDLSKYRTLFLMADPSASGSVKHQEGRDLFEKSGLPSHELAQIWRLSDLDRDGRLALSEFLCAMAIISRRRDGAPLPSAVPPLLLEQCQSFADPLSPEPTPAPEPEAVAVAPPPSAASDMAPESSAWTLSADEISKYRTAFQMADPAAMGSVGPKEGRELFERSRLPPQELAKIWHLSDVDYDGRLTLSEFLCAMAMIGRRAQGAPLPSALPSSLLQQCQSIAGAQGAAPATQPAASVEAPDPAAVPPQLLEQRQSLADPLSPEPTPAPEPEAMAVAPPPSAASDMAPESSEWTLSAEEISRYRTAFQMADPTATGSVGSKEGRELFERSRLPPQELAEIWRMSDVDCDGRLALSEFLCAMTMIGRRARGAPLPSALPSSLLQQCQSIAGAQAAAPATQPAASVEAPDLAELTLSSDELSRYRVAFRNADPNATGSVGPEEGRGLFEKSGLPAQDLAQIWRISDADRDGCLSLSEFLCAMAMISRRVHGATLPSVLPPSLVEQCQSVAAPGSAQPKAASSPSETVTKTPPPLAQSAAAPDPSSWKLSTDELSRYRKAYQVGDPNATGSVGPEEGRGLFEKSGLPAQELAHIWRICDVDHDGRLEPREFVCAMAITMRRRAGTPLPSALPRDLVESVTAAAHSASS